MQTACKQKAPAVTHSSLPNRLRASTQSCHKVCPKYIVIWTENETEHPLFKPNNLLEIVLSFYL
jgi:hypothetical protein